MSKSSFKSGESSTIIIIFSFILVAVAGYLMLNPSFRKQTTNVQKLSNDNDSGYIGKLISGTTTPYIEFNLDDYEKAKREEKDIILIYYANWCPICIGEAPFMEAGFNELDKSNAVGFRVNFNDSETDDDERALAKEQGIMYQHTKVILKRGEIVLKDDTPWSKEDFFDNVNNALGQ